MFANKLYNNRTGLIMYLELPEGEYRLFKQILRLLLTILSIIAKCVMIVFFVFVKGKRNEKVKRKDGS